jgi:hypothetical protein
VTFGGEFFGNQATYAGAGASDQHRALCFFGASICRREQRRHN